MRSVTSDMKRLRKTFTYLHLLTTTTTTTVARSSSGGVAICYLYFRFMDDVMFSHSG